MKLLSCILVMLCCTAWGQEPLRAVGIQSLVVPEYPAVARHARIAGEVHLKIRVEKSGKVAEIKSASGPDILVAYAKRNIVRWSYTPLPKDTEVDVVYAYRLEKPEVETEMPVVVEIESPFHVVITANLLSVTGYDEGFNQRRAPSK